MENLLGDFQNVCTYVQNSLWFLTRISAGRSKQIFSKALYSISFLWWVYQFPLETSLQHSCKKTITLLLLPFSSRPATLLPFVPQKRQTVQQTILHSDPLTAFFFLIFKKSRLKIKYIFKLAVFSLYLSAQPNSSKAIRILKRCRQERDVHSSIFQDPFSL